MPDKTGDHLFLTAKKGLPFVSHAENIYVYDEEGNRHIDGSSGAVICNIGYGDRRILDAVNRQAESTFFAYRLHFQSRPVVELAERLARLMPGDLDKIYFVSGGSEAIETAMKLSRQYFFSTGQGGRHVFISRRPCYHGSTLGALALTAYPPSEVPFRPMTQDYPRIPAPYCYRCAYGLSPESCDRECARELEKTILAQGPENVAGFVADAVTGTSIGALVPPEGYFELVQEVCRKYGVHLIIDEVMTGYGRTGAFFACDHFGIKPDILAMSKGMGSGYAPLGAVGATSGIVDAVMTAGGFSHGHSYVGSAMSCAIGLAVLDVIEEDGLVRNSAETGEYLLQGLLRLQKKHSVIGQVRGLGLFTALELVADPETREPFATDLNAGEVFTDIARSKGLIVFSRRCIDGLAGEQVTIAPPLITTREQVDEILEILDSTCVEFFKTIGSLNDV